MIMTIKEAAKLLNKLAQFTPDEKVELKFIESEPVVARTPPNTILGHTYAYAPVEKKRPGFQSNMRVPGTIADTAPKGFFQDDYRVGEKPASVPKVVPMMVDDSYNPDDDKPWYYN